MRWLLTLPAIVLLSTGAVACGRGSTGSEASTASSAIPTLRYLSGDYDNDDYDSHGYDADNDDSKKPRDRDNDSDNESGSYYDSDDDSVRYFGHAASATDRRAITALVKRYYAVAAAENGRSACSMIASSIAKSVPEDLGRAPGPPYLHGGTCAVVVSKLFFQNHRQLAIYASTLRVTGVRLIGNRGLAVLGFRTLPGRQIGVMRESGMWKIDALLDGELP